MNKSKRIKLIISLVLLFFILLISFNVTSVQDIICNQYGIAISYAPDDKIEIFNSQGKPIGTIHPNGHGWKRLVEFNENVTVYFVRDDEAIVYDYAGNRIANNVQFPYKSSTNTITKSYDLGDGKKLKYSIVFGYETLTIESQNKQNLIYHSTIFYIFKMIITLVVWTVASHVFNHYFDLIANNIINKPNNFE